MKLPILSKLFISLGIDPKKMATKIAGNYGKRVGEKEVYDRFMQSELGGKLKNLPAGKKYAFEFFSYFLSGIFDQKFNPENSFIGGTLKEILDDSAAEISKRTINGTSENSSVNANSDTTRMAFIEMLMRMEPEKATIIINRLAEMNENERRAFVKKLSMIMIPENFAQLAKLDATAFANLGKISQPKDLTQKMQKTTGEILDDINTWLRAKL